MIRESPHVRALLPHVIGHMRAIEHGFGLGPGKSVASAVVAGPCSLFCWLTILIAQSSSMLWSSYIRATPQPMARSIRHVCYSNTEETYSVLRGSSSEVLEKVGPESGCRGPQGLFPPPGLDFDLSRTNWTLRVLVLIRSRSSVSMMARARTGGNAQQLDSKKNNNPSPVLRNVHSEYSTVSLPDLPETPKHTTTEY